MSWDPLRRRSDRRNGADRGLGFSGGMAPYTLLANRDTIIDRTEYEIFTLGAAPLEMAGIACTRAERG